MAKRDIKIPVIKEKEIKPSKEEEMPEITEPASSFQKQSTKQKDENIKESSSYISWAYTIPPKSTDWYLIVALSGIILVWLALNYLHIYLLAVIIIFGLIVVLGKSLRPENQFFILDDEKIHLNNQTMNWDSISSASFLPYNNDYLIAFTTKSFPYTKLYVPVAKADIDKVAQFLEKKCNLSAKVSDNIADKIIRFLMF